MAKTCQSLRHEPYILPDNNEFIPSMTAKRFNDMKLEEEAEYYIKLKELIDKYKKDHQ
jgi:hypothetical protein